MWKFLVNGIVCYCMNATKLWPYWREHMTIKVCIWIEHYIMTLINISRGHNLVYNRLWSCSVQKSDWPKPPNWDQNCRTISSHPSSAEICFGTMHNTWQRRKYSTMVFAQSPYASKSCEYICPTPFLLHLLRFILRTIFSAQSQLLRSPLQWKPSLLVGGMGQQCINLIQDGTRQGH